MYNSAVTFRWATNSSFSPADQTISVPAQSSWYLSTQSTGRFYIGHGVAAALPCPKWQYICKQLSNPPPTTSRFNLVSDWICVIYHVTDACPLLCWAFAAGLCERPGWSQNIAINKYTNNSFLLSEWNTTGPLCIIYCSLKENNMYNWMPSVKGLKSQNSVTYFVSKTAG